MSAVVQKKSDSRSDAPNAKTSAVSPSLAHDTHHGQANSSSSQAQRGGPRQSQEDNREGGTTTVRNADGRSPGSDQHNLSTRRWDTWSPNAIALVAIVVTLLMTLIFGVPSWVYQRQGERRAEADSLTAAEANRLAAESNRMTMWQLCKSEVEIQTTAECKELLGKTPWMNTKRDAQLSVTLPKLEYSADFEHFTRHHGILLHLLKQRFRLDQELHALHERIQQHKDKEDSTTVNSQQVDFKKIAESILVNERQILALLSLVSLPGETEGLTSVSDISNDERPDSLSPVESQLDPMPPKPVSTWKGIEYEDHSGLVENWLERHGWSKLQATWTGMTKFQGIESAWFPLNLLDANAWSNFYSLVLSLCIFLLLVSYFIIVYFLAPMFAANCAKIFNQLGVLRFDVPLSFLPRFLVTVLLCLGGPVIVIIWYLFWQEVIIFCGLIVTLVVWMIALFVLK